MPRQARGFDLQAAAAAEMARHSCVATPMSCTDTHSKGPWMFCMPVNRFGQGTPISVSREPSVPPRIGTDTGVRPSSSTSVFRIATPSGPSAREPATTPTT